MPAVGAQKIEWDGVKCALWEWGTAYQTGAQTWNIDPEDAFAPAWWNLGSAGCVDCADFNGQPRNNCGYAAGGTGSNTGNQPGSNGSGTDYGTGSDSQNSNGLFAGGLFNWIGLGLVGKGEGKPPKPKTFDWVLMLGIVILIVLILKK